MIKNIENKIKLALAISVGSFVTSLLIVAMAFIFATGLINEQRKKIYVIDHGVPVLVSQNDLGENRDVERVAHVEQFHTLFFTLPPDDSYIRKNIGKAMYLIDDTGLAQYNNLKEKGFFNSVVASSAVLTIQTDSVVVDKNLHFRYYARQRIERPTSIVKRAMVTEGDLRDVPRTANNPHGLLITNWKTIVNKDLEYVEKKSF